MELGNLIFGNSRGIYKVPREWSNIFSELLKAIDGDDYDEYGSEYDGEKFTIMPYWWGDCTCGKDNPIHTEECAITMGLDDYISERIKYASGEPNEFGFSEVDFDRLLEFDKRNKYPECTCGGKEAFERQEQERIEYCGEDCLPTCISVEIEKLPIHTYLRDDDWVEKYLKPVYEKHGLPTFGKDWYYGWGAICDCEHGTRVDEWERNHPHKSDCKLVMPNFLYKPTGFEIQWYKYPMRDAYMNQKMSDKEFHKIILDCIKSIN